VSAPLKLVRTRAKPAPKAGVWPSRLARPVDPMETHLAARAHSILHSLDVREPRGLNRSEAIDVIRWAGQPV
jgi:hypothetical protein